MQINQPKCTEPKTRDHKLKSGINKQGALKQKRHKTRVGSNKLLAAKGLWPFGDVWSSMEIMIP